MSASSLGVLTEVDDARRTATRIGFPVAIALSFLAALGFLIGIFTLPRSGPYCTAGCMAYPYAEAAQFFPRDYWWMAPASLLAPLFTVLAVCLQSCIPGRFKPLIALGICSSALSTAVISIDYAIQVLAIQPSLVHGEMEGVALFTQYNPHGVFIVLEDLGYFLLAIGFLLVGMAVPISIRPGVWLRRILLTLGMLSFVVLATFAAIYGVEMALPFELAIITIVWIGLIVTSIQFALLFRQLRALPKD